MAKFLVELKENRRDYFEVEANDINHAKEKIEDAYFRGDIEVRPSCVSYSISAYNINNEFCSEIKNAQKYGEVKNA